jgi:tetratricopeptide (TPR) repeat protein
MGAPPNRLYCVALVLLTLLVYCQTLTFDFVKLDDNQYVTENPRVLDGFSLDSLRWAFAPTGYAANWHPLTWLSLMLDAELYGGWAGGFHLTNVLLHAVNSLLIFTLLRRATGESARSFVVAGLFAVHPLHVESVAWISERKDVLSTLFGLLSVAAYARFAQRARVGWYLAAWLGLLLSLMSKQMLVTLPCVFLLVDFWPLRRLGSLAQPSADASPTLWRVVVEKLPFALLSAVFCFVAVWAQAVGEALHSWDRLPLNVRLSNAALSYAAYLGQTFWPVDLAVFYPYPPAGRAWWEVAASVAVLLAVTVVTLIQWQRRPYLLMGWLWFQVTLLPVIGILQVGDQARADRYMYFPLLGLAIAGTWLFADVIRACTANPRVPRVIAAVVLLGFSALAWNQTRCWRDSVALFRRALEVTDDNWLAHATLASALMDDPERIGEAEGHLRESLRIRPNYATAHYNLALVLSDQGDLSQANAHFREALALKPDHVQARLLLCLNLKRLGQFEELARELAELEAQQASLPPEVQSVLNMLRSP